MAGYQIPRQVRRGRSCGLQRFAKGAGPLGTWPVSVTETRPIWAWLFEGSERAADECPRKRALPLGSRQRCGRVEGVDPVDAPGDRCDACEGDPRRAVSVPGGGDAHLRERPALSVHRL